MATETSTADTKETTRTEAFVNQLNSVYPDPLLMAILLAIVTLIAVTPYYATPVQQLEVFATGFFNLFALQMGLILFWVVSAVIAESRITGSLFDKIVAQLPTGSQTTVVYATGVVSLIFALFNWALGLIGGVLIGYKLAQRAEQEGTAVHYPAVLAASLLSLVIMNQGFSSPGALLMADPTGTVNFLAQGESGQLVLDMGTFLLNPVNGISMILFVVTLPLLIAKLAPSEVANRQSASDTLELNIGEKSLKEYLSHHSLPSEEEMEIADKLEQSRKLSVITVFVGGSSVVAYFISGGKLTLLWFLFAIIMLGILLQERPMAFVEKTKESTKWAKHVAIPFLLYANIHYLLDGAGLYDSFAATLSSTGVPQISSYFVALGLGLLIPDPGSVWVIQSPAVLGTGTELGAALVPVMYGAGMSNFWLSFLFIGLIGTVSSFSWSEYFRYAAVVTGYVSIVLVALLLAF